ncbi:unnamed protein product [Symbiodinium natans]|uniref:Uncharacterized protein n=1 Tax=Symbiodinium natans TaxID=878477 RepID=A0A812T187_9DINO|nr:unnamed protein product [Symbiodinium natans]
MCPRNPFDHEQVHLAFDVCTSGAQHSVDRLGCFPYGRPNSSGFGACSARAVRPSGVGIV